MVHHDSNLRLSHFEGVKSGKSKGIDEQGRHRRSEQIIYNRRTLRTMVETVIVARCQNFAQRGHRDYSQNCTSSNAGNFQALVNYRISGGDIILAKHFKKAKKNAMYQSKKVQNNFIKICG